MKKTLEEIFFRKGKFLDKKGKEISPKPIGKPELIRVMESELFNDKVFYERLISSITIGRANAFLRQGYKGSHPNQFGEYVGNVSIRLYYIERKSKK